MVTIERPEMSFKKNCAMFRMDIIQGNIFPQFIDKNTQVTTRKSEEKKMSGSDTQKKQTPMVT